MYKLGVASVSFRALSAEQVIELAVEAELDVIEWGSDIHAPCKETERLEQIVRMQKEKNIRCSSYGTYFRLGVHPIEELEGYISAAKHLGTNVLRIWCGNKNYEEMSEAERSEIIEEGKKAAVIAEAAGVVLCMECHGSTYTNCVGGAVELMKRVDSPCFKMYWQPNPYGDIAYNSEYARQIAPYVVNLHVFHWIGEMPKQVPLEEGLENWRQYLTYFNPDVALLLEFMPDQCPDRLKTEAESLRKLVAEATAYCSIDDFEERTHTLPNFK